MPARSRRATRRALVASRLQVRGEAVARVVGEPHRVGLVLKGGDREDGRRSPHGRGACGDKSAKTVGQRGHPAPPSAVSPTPPTPAAAAAVVVVVESAVTDGSAPGASDEEGGALVDARLDEPHLVVLRSRGDGALVTPRRRPRRPRPRPPPRRPARPRRPALHEHSSRRVARLARVDKAGAHALRDGGAQLARASDVRKDQVGPATQLECDALHRRRRRPCHRHPGACRTCEAHSAAGWRASASPAISPRPLTRLNAPVNPASTSISAKYRLESGATPTASEPQCCLLPARAHLESDLVHGPVPGLDHPTTDGLWRKSCCGRANPVRVAPEGKIRQNLGERLDAPSLQLPGLLLQV